MKALLCSKRRLQLRSPHRNPTLISMKQLAAIALTLMTTTGVALAGASTVHSVLQTDLTIEYELESGEPYKDNLSKGVSYAGYRSMSGIKDSGTTDLTVRGPDGAAVVTGKVKANQSYLVMAKGEAVVLVSVGTTTKSWTPYPGVVIVNTLGEAYKIDLFAEGGKESYKDIKIATEFDVKQAQKMPGADTRFKMIVHSPDGTTASYQSAIDKGSFYVLHKTYDGKLGISPLGSIEIPTATPTPATPVKATKPAKAKKTKKTR